MKQQAQSSEAWVLLPWCGRLAQPLPPTNPNRAPPAVRRARLALKVCVVLPPLAAVRALQVHHQGGDLVDLGGPGVEGGRSRVGRWRGREPLMGIENHASQAPAAVVWKGVSCWVWSTSHEQLHLRTANNAQRCAPLPNAVHHCGTSMPRIKDSQAGGERARASTKQLHRCRLQNGSLGHPHALGRLPAPRHSVHLHKRGPKLRGAGGWAVPLARAAGC
jgi:hypothetical protein